MSGVGYIGMTNKAYQTDELNQYFLKLLKQMDGKYNHTFSILYNAFTEQGLGDILQTNWLGRKNIYADSGGLQIVTRGMTPTDDMKGAVYKNQGDFADFGLCFDEIPVIVDGKSKRGDLTSRFFDESLLKNAACQSGKNLRRQIDTYQKNNSTCKPIFIVHGNCYDTYMRWCEYAMSELTPDYYDKIGGVAVGGAALGNGLLEDIKKTFYCSQLPIELPNNHFHLLGVGSPDRLFPIIILLQNGLYKNARISYDSTSQSSSLAMGKVGIYNPPLFRMYDIGRTVNSKVIQGYNSIKNNLPDFDYSIEDYHWGCISNNETAIELGRGIDRMKIQLAVTINSVIELMKAVNSAAQSPKKIIDMTKSHMDKLALGGLVGIKTTEEFFKWEDAYSHLIRSSPVRRIPKYTLEELF